MSPSYPSGFADKPASKTTPLKYRVRGGCGWRGSQVGAPGSSAIDIPGRRRAVEAVYE